MPQNETLASIGYYADEDCPGPVIRALRDSGFDVVAQHEIKRGAAVVQALPAVGVIIVRLRGRGDWQARAPRAVEAICTLGERAVAHISTIDWHATRTRPLPQVETP